MKLQMFSNLKYVHTKNHGLKNVDEFLKYSWI